MYSNFNYTNIPGKGQISRYRQLMHILEQDRVSISQNFMTFSV